MAKPLSQKDMEAFALDVARGHIQAGMWSMHAKGFGRRSTGLPGEFFFAGLFGPFALTAEQRKAWNAGETSPEERQDIMRLAFTPVETRKFEDEEAALRFCIAENLMTITSAQPGA